MVAGMADVMELIATMKHVQDKTLPWRIPPCTVWEVERMIPTLILIKCPERNVRWTIVSSLRRWASFLSSSSHTGSAILLVSMQYHRPSWCQKRWQWWGASVGERVDILFKLREIVSGSVAWPETRLEGGNAIIPFQESHQTSVNHISSLRSCTSNLSKRLACSSHCIDDPCQVLGWE